MSSNSSNYEDCIEYENDISRKKKKFGKDKRRHVLLNKGKYTLKCPRNLRKIKESNSKTNVHSVMKSSKRARHIERQFNLDEKDLLSLANNVDDDSITKSTDSNRLCLIPETCKNVKRDSVVHKDSGSDSDKLERQQYICLLSKLIYLNMPSNIESNRSNEAYTKRLYFLERRRYQLDKSVTFYQLFCSEAFWLELQLRVRSRKMDRIQTMQRQTEIVLKRFLNLKILNAEMDQNDIQKEKIYSISKTYLNKIYIAHKQVSDALSRYHYYLSFWPTTAAMSKHIASVSSDFKNLMLNINENIETMQAWLSCCEWLNWKTRQICQLVGISNDCVNDFTIPEFHDLTSCSYRTLENCHTTESKKDNGFTSDNLQDLELEIIHVIPISRRRSFSLTEKNNYISQKTDINSESCGEILTDNDCESKFDFFADMTRRRLGLEKVCCSTIDSVKSLLKKYQNLLSLTNDANSLPMMQTYADVLKKETNGSRDFSTHQVGESIIYSEVRENISECSFSSYQTAKVLDDSSEFPIIRSENSLLGLPLGSNSASPNPSPLIISGNMDESDDYRDLSGLSNVFENQLYSDDNTNFEKAHSIKGLLGIKNHVASRLNLPPLLPHYLFLARFPVKIMHSCIRKILSSGDLQKLCELSVITVKQKINDFKDALQFTMKAREFLFDITYGINFQAYKFQASNLKDFAPKQDIDHSEFMRSSMKEVDADLSILLCHYMECLKELLKKWSKEPLSCKLEREPRQLLADEWNFVKTYCHSIKQEEEIVASSFCKLTEYLFDLLNSTITSSPKLNLDGDLSPDDSPTSNVEEDSISVISSKNRKFSKSCQSYKNECKALQSRLKQATEFAKMLRSDLEICIQVELNSNFSINDLLLYLSKTRHKLVDLCFYDDKASDTQSDLTLIVPEESCSYLKELLHPLVTGFSLQPVDECLGSNLQTSSSSQSSKHQISREYLLIINKKSKLNWPGEKVYCHYPLDIGNLRQRIESTNIVFIARRPDELIEQFNQLLDFKVPRQHSVKSNVIAFRDVIQNTIDGQAEAFHFNSKLNLNALKSKVINVAYTLQNHFVNDEKDIFNSSESSNLIEETFKSSLKNAYSITFEFYRDLIRICTGDAFKNILKNTIIGLLDKWFKFSKRFEPSERGTVPRWANDGLSFLLQVCQSRVVLNMTSKEWSDFKKSIDNFVEFIVGRNSRQNSFSSAARSTISSRVMSSRSWLPQTKPPVFRGYDNSDDLSNSDKVECWNTECDNRTLRMAFSEPYEIVQSDQDFSANSKKFFVDKESLETDKEISFAIPSSNPTTSADGSFQDTFDSTHSNKSTDGSSTEETKCRKQTSLTHKIELLEKQLERKGRENKLMGTVRNSSGETDKLHYIKKAPFQWTKKTLIGQGRSGKVFKVCNLDTMKIMAMKEVVINEPYTHDPFEYDILCKLRHPSLIEYYGVDISLSHVRIFTEYCDSGSLSEISIRDIPDFIIRQWTKEILEAVVYLHDHKIVHRDIKPDNIFLINVEDTNMCHAKLGDFGVAKCLKNHENGLKEITGTIMYMAPEVVIVDSSENVSNVGYNQKVDIWSLGCVVLYMVTGSNPWLESQQFTIYYYLGQKKRPNIPDINERMSKEAHDFITSCLVVDAANRSEAIDLINFDFVKLPSQL